jgi:CYTH domain-containing protein
MEHRTAGEGRYARLEREQRFLLSEVPADALPSSEISDRYLFGTRLRLRRMEAEGHVVFKLCQKVRAVPADPEVVKLTNVYLSHGEFEVLSVLPGADLRKTRRTWTVGSRVFAVDEFHGPHRGIVLAETELSDNESRVPLIAHAIADVTNDDRYSGGALASVSEANVRQLLAEARQVR